MGELGDKGSGLFYSKPEAWDMHPDDPRMTGIFSKDMYRLTFRILETADEHFYAHQQFSYHWALNGLDLPDHVLEKIYHKNAVKIIGE